MGTKSTILKIIFWTKYQPKWDFIILKLKRIATLWWVCSLSFSWFFSISSRKSKLSILAIILELQYNGLDRKILIFSKKLLKNQLKVRKHTPINVAILLPTCIVLLNLLGNIFLYCPTVEAIWRSTHPVLISREGRYWICNWECLYCDSSQEIQWIIAWDLGKSLGLCRRALPSGFPLGWGCTTL